MKIRKITRVIVACLVLLPAPALAKDDAGKKAKSGSDSAAPTPDQATEKAPEEFRVRMETTQGPFVVEVTRAWSPEGADRFYNLVKLGFFEDIAFFRVIPNFMVQFGIHGDPKVAARWQGATIKDDPVLESNLRGTITYAKTGRPNSRTTQLFINFKDNTNLDRMGFSPFGRVVEGMEVVDSIYKVGEGQPRGPGPHQGLIQRKGNAYLKESFPKLDYIEQAVLLEEKPAKKPAKEAAEPPAQEPSSDS